MNRYEPEWYEALRGNPLKTATFTEELKARIRSKAQESSARKVPGTYRVFKVGISFACAVGIIALLSTISLVQQGNLNLGRAEVSTSVNDWQNIMDAKYPDTSNKILLEQSYDDDTTWLFHRRIHEYEGTRIFSVGLDIFERESGQWNYGQSFSMSYTDPRKMGRKDKVINFSALIDDRIPVILGVIVDPDVRQVRVVDPLDKFHTGNLFDGGDGYTYWFLHLDAQVIQDRHYTVEGLDREGNVISSNTLYF